MATIIPVASFDCVVFGATGDLTTRKLLPALYYRFKDGQIPGTSRIIGASRSEMSAEAFRERARDAIKRFVPAGDVREDTLGCAGKRVAPPAASADDEPDRVAGPDQHVGELAGAVPRPAAELAVHGVGSSLLVENPEQGLRTA